VNGFVAFILALSGAAVVIAGAVILLVSAIQAAMALRRVPGWNRGPGSR
jgi:hypothetical protein